MSENAKKEKKKFYKRWWFWVLVVIVIFIVAGASGNDDKKDSTSSKTKNEKTSTDKTSTSKSDDNSKKSNSNEKVSTEDKNAYESAKSYMEDQGFSKKGLYEQLTSDAGEGFKPEAANYAISKFSENDYKEAAVKSAKSYSKDMHMSANGVYEQLTSDAGEKYTPDQAKYAINKLHLGTVTKTSTSDDSSSKSNDSSKDDNDSSTDSNSDNDSDSQATTNDDSSDN